MGFHRRVISYKYGLYEVGMKLISSYVLSRKGTFEVMRILIHHVFFQNLTLLTLFMFRYVDGSWRYKSLDDIWYYGGQDEHQQEAIMAHNAKDREEIDLNVGDIIGVAGNHWNGYNKGRNHANNRIGLYPEYKTKEKLKIVSFPSYPHVHL